MSPYRHTLSLHESLPISRGPDRFLGYYDTALNDEAFTADGWFRTGDLGSVDDAGYLTIAGRRKDIIIRKGENISAKEVEDRSEEHTSELTSLMRISYTAFCLKQTHTQLTTTSTTR